MEIRLNLIDGPAPSGQVRASDDARISAALHEISIRLGRQGVDKPGPGRSLRGVEADCEVRLVGLREGSTVLEYAVGPVDALPVEVEEVTWHREEMQRILTAMARDERPDEVGDLVADAVADLVGVIRVSARELALEVGDQTLVRFRTDSVHRETWTTPRRAIQQDEVTLVGVLEKVDIHSHELRLRDDVGNSLDLVDVREDVQAGTLIGRKVHATGQSVHSRDGRLIGISRPEFAEHASVIASEPSSEVFQNVPTPIPEGQIELTDEEYESYMKAMGR